MNVLQILNTIRANSSAFYQDRIPTATKQNLTDIGNQILTYESLQNEFVSALVNKIAFTEVSSRRFKNPLAVLKSSRMPFGNTWEEVHINPAKDKGKSTKENEVSDLIGKEESDVATIYHSVNRYGKYKVSYSYEELQTAFLSINHMSEFIQGIIDSMYSGDEMDEFILMKNTLGDAITKGYMVSKPLTYTSDESTSKDLIVLLKTLSHNFTEPSKEFNGYNLKLASEIQAGTKTGRITWTPKDNQVIFIRADVDARTDVEVLAKAFNMEKAEFIKRKFVVSSFGAGAEDVLCVLADDSILKFKDVVYTVRQFQNGNTLVDNYFLHHKQVLSYSLFGNAVAITQASA